MPTREQWYPDEDQEQWFDKKLSEHTKGITDYIDKLLGPVTDEEKAETKSKPKKDENDDNEEGNSGNGSRTGRDRKSFLVF